MSTIQVAAGVILRQNQVLIAQRPQDKHKGGYWEFPGGKIEINETAHSALARELKEELNIEITEARDFTEVSFEYPEKKVQLNFFLVTEFKGEPIGLEGQPVKWVNIQELNQVKLPEANVIVVEKLTQLFL
ncbi:8-oxo-dGTP diphosphatase MutT [Aliikangiella sp. IMCC44359]|uniref:8-oxo-dGTP diphosphatase MutT n=1 Tax=Aliikangiella sp. IMCC44359 TaxID=3459125 RepID=UPI00403A9BC0